MFISHIVLKECFFWFVFHTKSLFKVHQNVFIAIISSTLQLPLTFICLSFTFTVSTSPQSAWCKIQWSLLCLRGILRLLSVLWSRSTKTKQSCLMPFYLVFLCFLQVLFIRIIHQQFFAFLMSSNYLKGFDLMIDQ